MGTIVDELSLNSGGGEGKGLTMMDVAESTREYMEPCDIVSIAELEGQGTCGGQRADCNLGNLKNQS